MKILSIFVLSVASLAAQKNIDPSVTWTIYSGYEPMAVQPAGSASTLMQACIAGTTGCTASAINGDGSIYSGGSPGVSNCVIHISGGIPTYDATLLVNSPRSISFNLHDQVASLTASQPSWATSIIAGGSFLNVSHILEGSTLGSTIEADYTTRLTSALPVKGTYNLRMDNPSAMVPPASYYGSFDYNSPYTTALVWVHHCPDTNSGYSSSACPAGHKESWYVYPDAGTQTSSTGSPVTQVSTLVTESKTTTGVAQYSTPFFFKIELQ
jgi:hypothetical protein